MVLTDRSQRKVLLAITIAQQAYFRGIVRYAREHDWHLVTDMACSSRGRSASTIASSASHSWNFLFQNSLEIRPATKSSYPRSSLLTTVRRR
jgi:hypothetical protein